MLTKNDIATSPPIHPAKLVQLLELVAIFLLLLRRVYSVGLRSGSGGSHGVRAAAHGKSSVEINIELLQVWFVPVRLGCWREWELSVLFFGFFIYFSPG